MEWECWNIESSVVIWGLTRNPGVYYIDSEVMF